MKIRDFIKAELSGWTKFEKIFLPIVIAFVIVLSLCVKDSRIVTVEAVFGVLSTMLAGKGKISCYIFGIISVLLYAYINWINNIYGLFALYLLYYFPMDIIGIFAWEKHLKSETMEIKKTCLSKQERVIMTVFTVITSIGFGFVLTKVNGQYPFVDSFAAITAIVAIYLTVKRCIEQWFVWIVFNSLNFILYIFVFINGEPVFATILKWFIYICLSFYFFFIWKKELDGEKSKIYLKK